MPTQYTPARKTIGELLSMTNPPILVPDWQRNYSWTTTEVETYWQDMMLFSNLYPEDNVNAEEYFLGSVVIVDNGTSHLLLDGQQRLATSAILLSVIRDQLAKYSKDASLRTSQRYLTDFDDARDATTYKLTLNVYDRDFFKREILETRDMRYEVAEPTIESHRLIRKAREFFISRFELMYNELNNPRAAYRWSLRIQKILTDHISVVAVLSNDEDNAASVFETLNDRGIGLSTPDLLRNFLLRIAREEDRVEIIDLWREIFSVEEDAKLETFIRHFWLSYEGDVKTRKLYREIKSNIIKKNVNSLEFSRSLRDSSTIYSNILDANDNRENISYLLKSINDLGASLLYPALLSGYENDDNNSLEFYIKSLLVAYVRHSVIGRLENSRLEDIVFSIAKDIRKSGNFMDAIHKLREFSLDDLSFINSFKRSAVTKKAAHYILRELEYDKRRTQELEVSTPSKVHVEHIYSQNPQNVQRWNNHDQMINRLGNLTLLDRSINTSIKNSPFSHKKPHYKQSEILLTQELLDYDEWTAETVEKRQDEMSKNVAKIWAFPILD